MLALESFQQRDTTATLNPSLERKLSKFVYDTVAAINARSFSANSYPWNKIPWDFTAGTAFPDWPESHSLEEFLSNFDRQTRENSTYHLEVLSTTVTPNSKATTATVFILFATTGFPVGVTRDSVGLMHFKKMGEIWTASKYQCLPGCTVYENYSV